jgi:DNA-binding CsgD family transcriptional regulator
MTGQTPVALAAAVAARTPSDVSALNRRDIEVLRCLANGNSTAQIAASLSVSSNTARTRIRRLQVKLDVPDRTATVRAARDLGVLRIPRLRTG